MRSLRFIDRQAGYSLSALSLLVALVAPGLVPAFASADVVTDRSISMSSSSAGETATYDVEFTTGATGGADTIFVDFCSDSPIIGEACGTIDGFTAAGATTSTSGYTIAAKSATQVKVTTSALSAGATAHFALDGIVNPGAAGSFYARITTYDSTTQSTDITNHTPTVVGNHVDEGGVALSATDSIGVSGKVLESLVFCVSGDTIDACDQEGGLTTPSVALGHNGVLTTDPADADANAIYTDISTNAATGAVVALKSNAVGCGGLIRAGAAADKCDIGPASSDVTDGSATFGVKLSALTAAGSSTGLVEAADYKNNVSPSNFYDATHYKINFVDEDAAGSVTSTYGDPILDTNGKPVNNGKLSMSFAASTNDATPAGRYSADLSLIATGKF